MCIFSIVCVGELQFPTTGKQILGQRYWRKLKLQIGSDKIHFLSCFLLLFFILMFTHLKKPSVILTFSLPLLCFTYIPKCFISNATSTYFPALLAPATFCKFFSVCNILSMQTVHSSHQFLQARRHQQHCFPEPGNS